MAAEKGRHNLIYLAILTPLPSVESTPEEEMGVVGPQTLYMAFHSK